MSYILRSSLHFFRRFPGKSLLFCMVIVVLLLCIHGLLFVQAVLGHARHNISDRLTMTLYVKEDYSKESRNMKNFLDELELFEYGSIPVTYIDKEIALDRYVTTDPDLLGILGGENPFPDAIVLHVPTQGVTEFDNLMQRYTHLFIEGDTPGYQQFQEQVHTIRTFQKNYTTLQLSLGSLLVIFALCIIFFVFLFLQNNSFLFERELRVAALTGASRIRVVGPYIFFALTLGLTSFVIAFVVTWYLGMSWPLSSFSFPLDTGRDLTFGYFFSHSVGWFALEALFMAVVAFSAGYFGPRRVYKYS